MRREVTPPAEAVIVVDVQAAFFAGDQMVEDGPALLQRLHVLVERARTAGVPVVLVRNDGAVGEPDEVGTPGWELALGAGPEDLVLGKRVDDAFEDPDLAMTLRRSGVETVVVVGVFSEMCVAATARGALRAGLNVIVPHDGHSTIPTPAWPGVSEEVPAPMVSRVAEWSLGDEVHLLPSTADVEFGMGPATTRRA